MLRSGNSRISIVRRIKLVLNLQLTRNEVVLISRIVLIIMAFLHVWSNSIGRISTPTLLSLIWPHEQRCPIPHSLFFPSFATRVHWVEWQNNLPPSALPYFSPPPPPPGLHKRWLPFAHRCNPDNALLRTTRETARGTTDTGLGNLGKFDIL